VHATVHTSLMMYSSWHRDCGIVVMDEQVDPSDLDEQFTSPKIRIFQCKLRTT
jgi:hypothetical protein